MQKPMIRCPTCSFQNSSDTSFCGKCRLYLHPIGGYTLIRLVGKGGFASVYEAIHPRTRKKAAIKILHQELMGRPDVEHRFLREAKVLLELNHPQIVKLYDFGLCDAEGMGIYLIMEWCDGHTLRAALDSLPKRRFSGHQARSLFSQLLMGLHHIHQNRVVHRDLKPSNLILLEDKGELVLKILDFGLAWVDEDTLTKTGTVVGSLRYMAPEQFRGDKDLYGPETDLYSAGLILAWMLTGSHVFSGSNVDTLALQHIQEEAPTLRDLCPSVEWSLELEQVLARALAKEPSMRFPSAQAFLEAFEFASLPDTAGSHLDFSSVSPYEETIAMGQSRTRKPSSFGWLIPLALLLGVGIFVYVVAIAPDFLRHREGGGTSGGDAANLHEPAKPRREVSAPDARGGLERASKAPIWVRTLVERWRKAWVEFSKAPNSPKAQTAFREFFHKGFRDVARKQNKAEFLQSRMDVALKSSWVRVLIRDLELMESSQTHLVLKLHQTVIRSTVKAVGKQDEIVGGFSRERGFLQMHWVKNGRFWQIKEINFFKQPSE